MSKPVRLGVCLAIAVIVGGCVPPEPITVFTSALPNGAVDAEYSQELAADAEGGAVWAVISGELPPGLQLDARYGTISGTPTEPGAYEFTLQATDQSSIFRRGEATFTITIHPRLQLSAALDPGRVQEPYSETLAVTGGVPPYTFSVVGLPAGIGLDPATGVISGTPIYPVDGELLRISVSDSGTPRQTATASVPLVIKGLPVRIATDSLADVAVGSTGYSQKLQAAEGVPPYHWAVFAGSLAPLGLELVLSTGEIRNRRDAFGQPIPIPAGATTSTFTIKVTDSDQPPSTATKQFTVGVDQITTAKRMKN